MPALKIQVITDGVASKYVPYFPDGTYILDLVEYEEYTIFWRYLSGNITIEYTIDLEEYIQTTIHILVGSNLAFWQSIDENIQEKHIFYNEAVEGHGTAAVSFAPPKAINPTPTDGKLNIKIHLNQISWELPEIIPLEFKVYINEIFQGSTEDTDWNTSKIYTTPPTPFGAGYYLPLPYETIFTWRIDTYDPETGLTTTGDDWIFTTQQQWGTKKPDEDIENKIWIPNDVEEDEPGNWEYISDNLELYIAGGGRYTKRTVIVTFDENGKGKILVR